MQDESNSRSRILATCSRVEADARTHGGMIFLPVTDDGCMQYYLWLCSSAAIDATTSTADNGGRIVLCAKNFGWEDMHTDVEMAWDKRVHFHTGGGVVGRAIRETMVVAPGRFRPQEIAFMQGAIGIDCGLACTAWLSMVASAGIVRGTIDEQSTAGVNFMVPES